MGRQCLYDEQLLIATRKKDLKVEQGFIAILSPQLIGASLAPLVMAQSLISGDITSAVADPSGAVDAYASSLDIYSFA